MKISVKKNYQTPKEKHLQIPLNYGAPRSKNVRCAGGALRVALSVCIYTMYDKAFSSPLSSPECKTMK